MARHPFLILALALSSLGVIRSSAASESISPERCATLGFDAPNLACSTCELLASHSTLSQFRDECASCCSTHLDPSEHYSVPKYAHAVLLYDEHSLSMYNSVKEVVEQDIPQIRAAKGKAFQTLKGDDDGRGPALLFFKGSGTSGRVSMADADRVVHVGTGWKRDDIRDMVMAVLPGGGGSS